MFKCSTRSFSITFNDRSLEKITKRKSKVVSWYLDMNLLQGYLGSNRIYHHTAPVNMIFALNEGLKNLFRGGTRFENCSPQASWRIF